MSANRDLERAGIELAAHRPGVAAALTFIAEHFQEPITTEQIADAGNYAQRGLQDAFRRDLHRTPTDLIIELRLRAARDALTDRRGPRTVRQAALQAGALHAGRFSVRYRNLFGETPRQTLQRR